MLSVLLNCAIALEINVCRRGPLDIKFLKSAQESSDLWRVTCFSCCALVTGLLPGVALKKSTSPRSLPSTRPLNAETAILLS